MNKMFSRLVMMVAFVAAGSASAGLVAKWDFNNYDSANPTSDQVLRATVGSDGVACRRGSPATVSTPIGDGTLGGMYMVTPDYSGSDTEAKTAANALGAGNYAIAIPLNYHVKLPLPAAVKGHVWSMKIRFWSPAASQSKWRTFFDIPQDQTPAWGKLFINNKNQIGGGYFASAGGNYSRTVAASSWHTLTISAGEKRSDVFYDESTECCYMNPGTIKDKFQNADYIILNADTYASGDEGNLMYIDYIELYDEASVYEGKAAQYSKASLTGEWTFPAANPLQATIGRNLENYTYSGGTIRNSSRTDGVITGDTCVRTLQKSGFKAYHGLPPNASYTVVMDVRAPSSSGQDYRALFQPDPANASYYSCLYFFQYNKLYVAKNTFANLRINSKDTWSRIVCTYTHNGQRVCYQNGVQIDSRTSPGKCQVTGNCFYFGVDNTGSDFDTDFSYIAIYDRVLSAAEVAELHSRPIGQDSTGASIPTIAPAGLWQADGNGGFTAVKGAALAAVDDGFVWTRPTAPAAATYVMDVTLPATQTEGGTLVKNAAGVATGIYGTSSIYNGSFHTTTDANTFTTDSFLSTWGYWSENALDRTSAHRLAVTWAANGRVHYYVDGRPWGQLFPLNANTAAKPSSVTSFLNGLGGTVTEIRAYDSALTPDEVASLGGPGTGGTGNVPTVSVTASSVPDPVKAMLDTVSFTITGTQADGEYLSYAVDWGDGDGSASTTLVPSGTAHTFTHIYSAPGTYTPIFKAFSQNGIVGTTPGTPVTVVSSEFAAADVLLTWPWQQNVYTNRFTIMCEGVKDSTDETKWDGLEVQWGEGYANRTTMTRVLSNGNTWLYKAHITIDGMDGQTIPYRLGYYGLPLTYTDVAQNTEGTVRLWSQDENESFTCSIWGDNQQGACGGDWDSDRYRHVRAVFNHMVAQNVDFGLTTGDMASSASYAGQIQPGVLRATDDILGRTRPYYLAWGNHDTSYPANKPYFETGAADDPTYQDSASGNHYLYRNGVLFIFIDHALMGQAATRTWLESVLSTERAQAAKFRFILQHQPMWCEDWPIEGGAQNLLALAKTYKVDAVFSGHVHCYEHIDHEGLVQITNGGLGFLDHDQYVRTSYGADTSMGGHKAVPFLWRRQRSSSENNVLGPAEPVVMGNLMSYGEIRVEGNTFRYIAHGFNADGSYIGVFDDFTLTSKTRDGEGTVATQLGDATPCSDPASFAEFTTKPVTNAKWAEYQTAIGAEFTYPEGQGDAPVVNVSKTDIEKFLVWLNGETGDYRLPTIGELRTAFGDQLRREVSEWSSSVDRNSGRCFILGSPAIAREGTWERPCDQPEIGNERCHANYLGFRLATGVAPVEPVNPLAAPLAAVAALETPAAAYKWTNGALVDISTEFFSAVGSLVYDDPVILTGAGAVVREGDGDLTFNAGLAAPNSTSFIKSGAGKLTVKGVVKSGACTNLDGWVLDAGAGSLALDGVTYIGEGVSLRSADRTVSLSGVNDFAGADLAAYNEGNSVTNFVAASDAATSFTAWKFSNVSAPVVSVATNVTMTLKGEYRGGDAVLWIDGVLDAEGYAMSGNLTSYVYGNGEARIGWRRAFENSWTFFGVSNLCFTTARPLRESKAKDYNMFLIDGERIRITSTCDFAIPGADVNGKPTAFVQLSDGNKPQVNTVVFDTEHAMEFAPQYTSWYVNRTAYERPWNLIKEGEGVLTLKTPVNGSATVRNGIVKIAKRPTAGATATEGDGKWQIDETLTLGVGQSINGAFASGGTLSCNFGGTAVPGYYGFLAGAGLTAEDVTVTHDLESNPVAAHTVFDGNVAILVSDCVKTAVWTGEGVRSNPLDPANWAVTNAGARVVGAVPDANTAIFVTGATAVNVPATAGFVYGELVLGEKVMLTADCDWTGFAGTTLRSGLVLDLQGHSLKVGSLTGVTAGGATITDTTTDAEHPGELHVKVAEGVTSTNDKVNLTGNFKLVKEGAGTFVAAKTAQSYTAGTEIREGALKLAVSGGMPGEAPVGYNTADHRCQVWVESRAEFDIGTALTGWGYHQLTLNGGTLKGRTTQPNFTLVLTADSTIDSSAVNDNFGGLNGVSGGIWATLNGHTLSLKVAVGKTCFVSSVTGPGTLHTTTQGGWTQFYAAIRPENPAQRFSLDHEMSMQFYNDVDVNDYYANSNSTYMDGTAKMRVFGTFTPAGNSFYGCELQDGASIDLSGKAKAECWSTTRTNTGTNLKGNGTVTFADNAMITLKLGDRHFGRLTKVIGWTAAPANLATLTFQGETKRQKVLVRDDGVWVVEPSLIIILK